MRKFYMVSIQHKKDADVHSVFVTYSSKNYNEFEAYVRQYLEENTNFAELRRVSLISLSKYEQYKEYGIKRSLACLQQLFDQKKKQEKKNVFKQLFVF